MMERRVTVASLGVVDELTACSVQLPKVSYLYLVRVQDSIAVSRTIPECVPRYGREERFGRLFSGRMLRRQRSERRKFRGVGEWRFEGVSVRGELGRILHLVDLAFR